MSVVTPSLRRALRKQQAHTSHLEIVADRRLNEVKASAERVRQATNQAERAAVELLACHESLMRTGLQ